MGGGGWSLLPEYFQLLARKSVVLPENYLIFARKWLFIWKIIGGLQHPLHPSPMGRTPMTATTILRSCNLQTPSPANVKKWRKINLYNDLKNYAKHFKSWLLYRKLNACENCIPMSNSILQPLDEVHIRISSLSNPYLTRYCKYTFYNDSNTLLKSIRSLAPVVMVCWFTQTYCARAPML